MKSEQRLAIDRRFLQAYLNLYAEEKVTNKRDFCKAVGLLPPNFSIIKRGDLSCTVENIYRLSAKFGVSLDWLFFGKGDFYGNSAV